MELIYERVRLGRAVRTPEPSLPLSQAAALELARFEADRMASQRWLALLFPAASFEAGRFLRQLRVKDQFHWMSDEEQAAESRQIDPWLDDPATELQAKVESIRALHEGHRPALMQRCFRASRLAEVVDFCRGRNDHFIGQNLFRWPSRTAEALAGLTSCWVDLDVYKVGLDLSVDAHAADAVASAFWPPPTHILRTGRGLLARWIFDHYLPPAAAGRWRHVQAALAAKFKNLGADRQAQDSGRVFRVVGSVNSRSRTTVRLIRDGQKVGFDTLAGLLLQTKNEPGRPLLDEGAQVQPEPAQAGG